MAGAGNQNGAKRRHHDRGDVHGLPHCFDQLLQKRAGGSGPQDNRATPLRTMVLTFTYKFTFYL
jgi:hypothetical protein